MSSNNTKALKSGIWYTISNFMIKGIGFITTPIFTRLLTKAEFGAYNNFISWMSIFTIFVTLNLESTLISARYEHEDKFDNYILSVLSLSSLSAIIWWLILSVFQNKITTLLGIEPLYLNAMLVYLLFLPAVNFFQARERYFFNYKKTVLTSAIISVGTALLSVMLVYMLTNALMGRIFGQVIPTILVGVVFYIYFIFKGRNINVSYWSYALKICIPYIPHLLSLTLLNSTDRVMIDRWCGNEATALYSLAYSCGTIVTLLLTSVNSAFSPWLGEKLNEKLYKEIRAVSKTYILLFGIMVVGIMLISPEVLWVLGGSAYLEAKYVMPPVAMGCFCQFLYTMFVNVEQFKKKTMGMAVASVSAAVLNLLLNWIFIPRFGYLAAAYTTLAGYVYLLVVHMFLVKKIGYAEVYNYVMVIGIVILGIGFTVLVNVLYSIQILRYLLVLVYVIGMVYVVLKHRNKIMQLFKR